MWLVLLVVSFLLIIFVVLVVFRLVLIWVLIVLWLLLLLLLWLFVALVSVLVRGGVVIILSLVLLAITGLGSVLCI